MCLKCSGSKYSGFQIQHFGLHGEAALLWERVSSAPTAMVWDQTIELGLAAVFHLQKLFQVFMLPFPLPAFHINFRGQKAPISSAHLYALKPSNALTAMTIYAAACSATGFF